MIFLEDVSVIKLALVCLKRKLQFIRKGVLLSSPVQFLQSPSTFSPGGGGHGFTLYSRPTFPVSLPPFRPTFRLSPSFHIYFQGSKQNRIAYKI